MKQIFPKEILAHTVEVHRFAHSSKSRRIYTLLLAVLVGSFLALPWIEIDIYTTARGMLKPNKERVVLRSLHAGKVVWTHVADNQQVRKGDTLLRIHTGVIRDNINHTIVAISDTRSHIADCHYLANTQNPKFATLQSAHYQKEYLSYRQKVKTLAARLSKAKTDYQRTKALYTKGVIAKVAYEEGRFEYRQASHDLRQYKTQQKNSWQASLTQYQTTLRELENRLVQLEQDQQHLTIIAPMDGVLKNVPGIAVGSLIPGGTAIAEISPSTPLIAECYVAPKDIGQIRKGNPVNFQIDAFHYNQWGVATGRIVSISKDVDMIEGQPFFTIRCAVDQKHLTLSNGFKGHFNKGMTLQSRFWLARRSIYQLLYDNVDDWLNPSGPTMATLPTHHDNYLPL